MSYNRTFAELEKKAVKWWPKELEVKVAAESVIPKLIATQDRFISILKLSGDNPHQVFDVLQASGMSANLFLKHLVILADYGGELIKRLGREFTETFAIDPVTNRRVMRYVFRGKTEVYEFQVLPVNGLGNTKLDIDGVSITKVVPLSPLYKDLIMILLHGATSDVAHLAALEKCEIGVLLGDEIAIDKYVREKYLYVSRITTGANTNSLGQIAQTYVLETLRGFLTQDYQLIRNGSIILNGYDKSDGMPFDVVVERNGKKIGIEVSFQVTTNSVIERKSGQAENRFRLMNENGFWIAYVIDGAGNFQRASAIGTICNFSDCTVAYSQEEIAILANFIQEKLNN
ncbi:restriction endonuclease [Pseudanabaena sp. ABRG5-3]|uniref:restriction endonuclease n=1 Tax=Pseudanabaena sp. ABRG5-3 TaxID=685565 RepID=UPI000DC70CD1|nr:restriction endonuclease [Pseudanabaena sp. ABRG5-3]BBC22491.1 type-2 restriction enzyme BanI [Pseudanabaena sp. ABRG5-3]